MSTDDESPLEDVELLSTGLPTPEEHRKQAGVRFSEALERTLERVRESLQGGRSHFRLELDPQVERNEVERLRRNLLAVLSRRGYVGAEVTLSKTADALIFQM